MLNFISSSFAQEVAANAAAPTGQFSITSLVPLFLIFFIFYFLIIRPQNKKFKEQKEFINNLKRGDEVITSSGIIGKISEVGKDNIITLEIADGIEVEMQNHAILGPKNPAKIEDKKSKK